MVGGVKKFFRFLRGELNGYYLTKIYYAANNWVDAHINRSLCYMRNAQFELGKMNKEDMFNIAKFAGVTQILTQGTLITNLLLMTISEMRFDGSLGKDIQISERGLYDTEGEVFDFRYWNAPTKDIVDNATTKMQATLVPDGMQPIGYIPEGGIIYDKNGEFIPEAVLPEPPTDKPYTNFYGEKFLHMGESYIVYRAIPTEVLYYVLLVVQNIKYNGASVKSFAELTALLVGEAGVKGEGFVKLLSHNFNPKEPLIVTWKYVVDEAKEATFKVLRLDTWRALVESFFPQIVLEEEILSDKQ